MENKLPNIPYNLPITMDIGKEHQHALMKEKRDMFYTLMKTGDLTNNQYKDLLEERNTTQQALIDAMNAREQRAKELQSKSWDVEYIREHGFNYFPTDEYLKETIFKGKSFFKGVRDYQVLDAYMLSKSTNMLITHGMRLGKTMISTLGMLNNEKVDSVLIVAPKSTLFDWKETINTWTEKRMVAKIVSADFKPKENEEALAEWYKGDINVIVVNIDHFIKYADTFAMRPDKIDLLLVDEAHFLANRNQNEMQLLSGTKAQALLTYRKQNVKFCWLLTGTPTKKYEYEILGLFYFLSPSNRTDGNIKLDNYKWFFRKFCNVVSFPSPSNGYSFEVANRSEYDVMMRELNLNHRIHRTTRDEFPNNMEMVFEDVETTMNAPQKKAYKSIEGMLKAMFLEIDNALARDTYLRQISLDHRLMKRSILNRVESLKYHDDPEYIETLFSKLLGAAYVEGDMEGNIQTIKGKLDGKYGFDKKGAKAEWLVQYLKENKEYIQGNKQSDKYNLQQAEKIITQKGLTGKQADDLKDTHLKQGRNPIVIFSQFKQFIYFFENDLLTTPGLKDMTVEVITGDNANEREAIRQRFQNGEIDVLLIQVDTVKTGTALFRSNTAIFCDIKYSNQDMLQAYKRIEHPDATDFKVTYRLMAKDSIDYRVKELVDTYHENTKHMNESFMADITGVTQNKAKNVFEDYLKNISK